MPDTTVLTMADVLGKTLPELSATSDMPDAETVTPEVTEEPEVAETPEVTEETEQEVEQEASVEKPVKKQTRDAIEREREYERKRADDLQEQLKKAVDAVERMTGQSAEKEIKTVEQTDPRPLRSSYDDPDEYENQFHAWSSRAAARVARTEAEKYRLEDDGKKQMEADQQSWQSRRSQFAADHPDFEDVVDKSTIQINNALSFSLFKAEDGPALAYHLCKNPKEAERINALPINLQIFELGKISIKINAKSNITKAPGPISPVKSRGSATSKHADDESMEEYAARRQAEMRSNHERASRMH